MSSHGLHGTPEYRILYAIHTRCTNKNIINYRNYGGRGISICDRWFIGDGVKSHIECFIDDMGLRPSKKHSIDRIDNDGDYAPGNCRWVTSKEQARNQRTNVNITYNNETMCLNDWAKKTGIERRTLAYRIKSGWETSDALTRPVHFGNKHKRALEM